MTPEETQLRQHINDLDNRFDQGLLAVTFSTLALSIQFSPKMGFSYPWMLVSSWILLFISSLLGGWRHLYQPVAYKWNLTYLENQEVFTILQDPQNVAIVQQGRAVNQHFQTINEQDRQRMVKDRQTNIKLANSKTNEFNRKFPEVLKAQICVFLVGVLLNGTFTIVNYLKTAAESSKTQLTAQPPTQKDLSTLATTNGQK